jgi:protein-L-isoaspartate(D-aspartate) O-methyltransferase
VPKKLVVLMVAVAAGLFNMSCTEFADAEAPGERWAAARRRMVEEQLRGRDITNERVLHAMETVPRHLFVPPESQADAYGDHPLPIGGGQTISQPYIVALMTQLLDPRRDDVVLEIGTGSGYQAAVLSILVRTVYSIEIDPTLAATAARQLERSGYLNVHVRQGDGFLGWPEAAPFDGILVTAAAPRVPEPLIAQLRDGGRLIMPLGIDGGQRLVRGVKAEGKLDLETIADVLFVPMRGMVLQPTRGPTTQNK